MEFHAAPFAPKSARPALFLALLLCTAPLLAPAQTAATPEVPDWALPSSPPPPPAAHAPPPHTPPPSPTHVQVAPPAGFHRPSRNFDTPIGIFDGQSDIGAALVPGSASYDAATGQYTINSAGYNIWYNRDEFRYLWKKMSGDVSFAADVSFPNADGFGDRKVVLIFRQNLDDDSKQVMVGEHGAGMIHLAFRSDTNVLMQDLEYRFSGLLKGVHAKRIGIEKHGDSFAIFISIKGEPMHQLGPPITLHLDEPFYVGIGFCSHLPATLDTAVISNVQFEPGNTLELSTK